MKRAIPLFLASLLASLVPCAVSLAEDTSNIIIVTGSRPPDDPNPLAVVFSVVDNYAVADDRVCVSLGVDSGRNTTVLVDIPEDTDGAIRLADADTLIEGSTDTIEFPLACSFDSGSASLSGLFDGTRQGHFVMSLSAQYEPTSAPQLIVATNDPLTGGDTFFGAGPTQHANGLTTFRNNLWNYSHDFATDTIEQLFGSGEFYPGTNDPIITDDEAILTESTIGVFGRTLSGRRGLLFRDNLTGVVSLAAEYTGAQSGQPDLVEVSGAINAVWRDSTPGFEPFIDRRLPDGSVINIVGVGEPLPDSDSIAWINSQVVASAHGDGICVFYDASVASDPSGPSRLVRSCQGTASTTTDSAVLMRVGDVVDGQIINSWTQLRQRQTWGKAAVVLADFASGERGLVYVGPGADDSDGDGVPDDVDNCITFANVGQQDSNGDGYGNACDADLNNDCIVNPLDLGLFKLQFFTTGPDADYNSDGIVNAVDLGVQRRDFFQPPGPSAFGGCSN